MRKFIRFHKYLMWLKHFEMQLIFGLEKIDDVNFRLKSVIKWNPFNLNFCMCHILILYFMMKWNEIINISVYSNLGIFRIVLCFQEFDWRTFIELHQEICVHYFSSTCVDSENCLNYATACESIIWISSLNKCAG